MWQARYEGTGAADVGRLWALLSDVTTWSGWNPDVTEAEIDGPFAVGSTIRMRTAADEVIPLRLAEVAPGRGFVDEAELDGILVRTDHRLESLGTTAGVVYAVTVSGPAPEPVLAEIGEAVSADFPQTIAGLLAAAR